MTAPGADQLTARPPTRPPRRRLPEPLVPLVVALVAGLLVAWFHHPRAGLYVVGSVLAVAALARLFLPARDAGLLVVRSRPADVMTLALLAAAVLVTAAVTPFPPAGG